MSLRFRATLRRPPYPDDIVPADLMPPQVATEGDFAGYAAFAKPVWAPVLVTFALISIVSKWNDYLWPLVITNTENMRTLTVGISYLFDAEGNNEWGVIMAATFFVVFPLLIVFLFAQRFIIDGLTAGATKG